MSAVNLPGALFVSNLWWYAFSVLRPAQALKPLGLYRGSELGVEPARSSPRGLGPHYSRLHREPVLLAVQPEGYDSVCEFDALSTRYEQVVQPFARPVFEELVRAMRPFACAASRILDASCGPGTEALELSELVPAGEVVGLDLSAGMVRTAATRAQQRGRDNTAFFQADVARMPEHFTAQFDLVYCSCAFHHYPDAVGALREMRRSLRDGGHAFIADAGPPWMKTIASPWARWGDPGWITFRTGEEFRDLFYAAGFSGFYWTEMLPGIGLSIGTR